MSDASRLDRKGQERCLIVNADDLGRTPGINAGIFRAHHEGIVTSATLMVAYPAAALAARHLDAHPDLGVGLHVALTGGPPVLPPADLPSLVDAHGDLPRRPENLGPADPDEVLREVRAQLARFVALTGRRPTHLDSHHHSHRHPLVFDAITKVAAEEGLPLRSASPEMTVELSRLGIATTDCFVEDFYGDRTTVADLLELIDTLEPGTTELMCHPAEVDEELRRTSTYADERDRELAVLCDPLVAAAVQEAGVRLIGFAQLGC